jgi:penicillin-binding protein 2
MYVARLRSVLIVLGAAALVLVAALARIQVIQGARYRDEADQRLRRPPGFRPTIRGTIYDRHGVAVAQDTGAFDAAVYHPFVAMDDEFVGLMARRWRVGDDEVRARVDRMWAELARLTKVPPEELVRRRQTTLARVADIRETVRRLHGWEVPVREETYGLPTSIPHALVADVSPEAVSVITARADEFPGLVLVQTRKREYPVGAVAPHVVGRLGEVAPEDLAAGGLNAAFPETDLRRYWPGDVVGKVGVEASCEDILRGARGFYQQGLGGEFLEDIAPVPGSDVHLTLDVALQADVEAILDHPPAESDVGRVVGAAVVLDCRSGEVLVLASGPRYDLRSFGADYADLVRDPRGPLVNRAISGLYPMGSIFKAVTATAGMHEGVLAAGTVHTCEGILHPETPNRFRCHVFLSRGYGHGPLELRDGIKKSCNVYFYTVAEDLGRRPGGGLDLALARDRLQTWAGRMGLGRAAGLGLPGEASGAIDVPEASRPGFRGRRIDPRNLAVGQGELLVTPLQAAQVYGLVATDGLMPPLTLIREKGPAETARLGLRLNPRYMATLRDAFTAVVNEPGGTGYGNANLPDILVAGKTGTAQAGKGREDHAWFVGFAPAQDPRIAFAVVVEHGGHGGAAAGPIARDIVRACDAHGYLGRPRTQPGPVPVGTDPAPETPPPRPKPVG